MEKSLGESLVLKLKIGEVRLFNPVKKATFQVNMPKEVFLDYLIQLTSAEEDPLSIFQLSGSRKYYGTITHDEFEISENRTLFTNGSRARIFGEIKELDYGIQLDLESKPSNVSFLVVVGGLVAAVFGGVKLYISFISEENLYEELFTICVGFFFSLAALIVNQIDVKRGVRHFEQTIEDIKEHYF
jgi:hypothetical protein